MSVDLLALLHQARNSGDWAAVTEMVPFSKVFGFELGLRDGSPMGIMRYRYDLVGNPAIPALHGGALGSLLESTAMSLVLWQTDAVAIPRTVSFTLEYFRPGKPEDTFCTGTIVRLGKRVASVRVEAWQDDPNKPVAVAHGTFLVERPLPDEPAPE